MSAKEVNITLSLGEALVLFEWLARTDDTAKLPIEHPAEQKVLWILGGRLEKLLPVFAADYEKLLEEARISVDSSN